MFKKVRNKIRTGVGKFYLKTNFFGLLFILMFFPTCINLFLILKYFRGLDIFLPVLFSLFENLHFFSQILLFFLVLSTFVPLFVLNIIFAILLLLTNVYFLMDALLYWEYGFRLDFEYYFLISSFSDFKDSISINLLKPLFFVFLIVWFLYLLLSDFFKLYSYQKISKKILSIFFISFILITTARLLIPKSILFLSENLFLNEELYAVFGKGFFERKIWLTEYKNQLDFKKIAKNFLEEKKQSETFSKSILDFPLYRQTESFTSKQKIQFPIREKPNIIFLFMESFQSADIQVLDGKYNVTPQFDRLSKKGILFRNFYATGVLTTKAVISSMFGILPRFSVDSIMHDAVYPDLIGVNHFLKKKDYDLIFVAGGNLSFSKKDVFMKKNLFDQIVGSNEIIRWVKKNKIQSPYQTSWGVYDEYMMEYMVDLLKNRKSKNPFFLLAFTVTNHDPWIVHSKKFPKIHVDTKNEDYNRFLQTIHYSDASLGMFFDELEKAGLMENTILVITSDTTQQPKDWGKASGYSLAEYGVRVPLLFLYKGLKPKIVQELSSQVDLFPTIIDIFGEKVVHHSFGDSLLREKKDKYVFFSNPFQARSWGLRNQQYKYVYSLNLKKSFLFDVKKDPTEMNNLAETKVNLTQKYHKILAETFWFFDRVHENSLFSPK